MLTALLLTACGPATTWLDGEWAITSWSARVGEPPVFEANLTDAGTIHFAGSGDWWESDCYYDGPDISFSASGTVVLHTDAWTYWALQDGHIWLAWGQNYAEPEDIVISAREGASFTASSTGQVWIGGLESVPITREYVLTRVTP